MKCQHVSTVPHLSSWHFFRTFRHIFTEGAGSGHTYILHCSSPCSRLFHAVGNPLLFQLQPDLFAIWAPRRMVPVECHARLFFRGRRGENGDDEQKIKRGKTKGERCMTTHNCTHGHMYTCARVSRAQRMRCAGCVSSRGGGAGEEHHGSCYFAVIHYVQAKCFSAQLVNTLRCSLSPPRPPHAPRI